MVAMGASMLSAMDAAQALADLTEISSQVTLVAILDRDGSILATTVRDAGGAERFVAPARKLLEQADRLALARGLPELSQLEASTLDGSVFAVRRDGRLIVATTRSDPTVGLIFYDLKHCLGSIDDAPAGAAADPPSDGAAEPGARPRPRPRRKADSSA
jgi:predicted regulator of Ras-like GTPase activity (Roadblock/LC7/MglB family)